MKRASFLATILALITAPFVKKKPVKEWNFMHGPTKELEPLKWVTFGEPSVLLKPYYKTSYSNETTILEIDARDTVEISYVSEDRKKYIVEEYNTKIGERKVLREYNTKDIKA